MSTLKVTQRRSKNGADKRQVETLRSLGLRRIGQTVERDPTVHLLTGLSVRGADGTLTASSNFAVLCMGAIKCSGRYHLELRRRQGSLLIARCTAVLHANVINGIIYLPV